MYSYCYIGTNEQGLSQTQNKLQEYSGSLELYLGTSGFHNFDMLCVLRSKLCILFDYNVNQTMFMEQTLKIIRNNTNRFDFVRNMANYLMILRNISNKEASRLYKEHGFRNMIKVSNLLNESCIRFYPNLSEDPSYYNNMLCEDEIDEVKYELTRNGSWLSTDDNYSFIRSLVLDNKITIMCADIQNTSAFLNMFPNIIYLSNIANYIDNKESYIMTLKMFNPNSIVIWTDSEDSLKQKITTVEGYIKELK